MDGWTDGQTDGQVDGLNQIQHPTVPALVQFLRVPSQFLTTSGQSAMVPSRLEPSLADPESWIRLKFLAVNSMCALQAKPLPP